MDPRNFDMIANALGTGKLVRRGALKLLVGAALGVSLAHEGQEAIAKRKRKRKSSNKAKKKQGNKANKKQGNKTSKRSKNKQDNKVNTPAKSNKDTIQTAATGGNPVLLARYGINLPNAGVDWSTVVYRPRQFTNGLVITDPTRGSLKVDTATNYAGWDFFSAYNWSVHRVATASDWLELQLNRAATIAVVWRGGPTVPKWLSGWTPGAAVGVSGKQFPTFQKRFAAGRVTLGAVYDSGAQPGNVTRDTYFVLLAEDNGTPSTEPSVPQGSTRPRPNETCPTWLHDQHVATGPDGETYSTWHPQIDSTHWCYYRHEHGSDPRNFSTQHQPLYGYAAAAHGMDEAHQGFKSIVFEEGGYRWMITQHFGTAGLARACNRFHTVGIAVRRASDNLLMADLHLMADFGRAVVNQTQVPLTPPTCPNQAAEALAAGSTGIRQLPAQSAGPVFYEPWRLDSRGNVLGITGTFTVNNPDGIVICNNANCDKPVVTGKSGSSRFFTANDKFGIVAGANTGNFYTDALGKRLMSKGQAGAVQQYLRPGTSLSLTPGGGNGHYYDVKAWGQPFVFSKAAANSTNRENSLGTPN